MGRHAKSRRLRRHLDQLAEIHDADIVRDVLHRGKAVSNEEIGQAEIALELR